MQAQAIVFPAVNQVEVQPYEVPVLRADEILIRTEFSGISQGTEIWALIGKRSELSFPTVPGYQSVGIVEEVGVEAQGFQVGQRVLFSSSRLADKFTPTWMGTHVSHGIAGLHDERPPILVADGVEGSLAALAALPAVSLRGIEMLKISQGDLVVVTGQGLIGQSSAQLARLRGATVLTTDVSAQRLRLSRECGADIVVNVREQDLAAAVHAIKPEGADVIIETTGRSEQFAPCIDLLRPLGQLLLQAWYPNPISFDFDVTHAKRPTIAITCGYDVQGVAASLDMMSRNELRFAPLLSHLVPFSQAPEIYAQMRDGNPDIMGVVFDWTRS